MDDQSDQTAVLATADSAFEERFFEARQAYNAGEFDKSVRLIDELTKQHHNQVFNLNPTEIVSTTISSESTDEPSSSSSSPPSAKSPTPDLSSSCRNLPLVFNMEFISLKTNRALAQFKLDSNIDNLLTELTIPDLDSINTCTTNLSANFYQSLAFLIYNRSVALSVHCRQYQEPAQLLEQFLSDKKVWSHVDCKLVMKMFMLLIVLLVEKLKRPTMALKIIDTLCEFCKTSSRSVPIPDYYSQLQMRCHLMLNKVNQVQNNKPIPELIAMEPHVRSELEFRQGKFTELCDNYRFYKDSLIQKYRTISKHEDSSDSGGDKTTNKNDGELRLATDPVSYRQFQTELSVIYNNSGIAAFYSGKNLFKSAVILITESIKVNPSFKNPVSSRDFPFEQFYNLGLIWLHSGTNSVGLVHIFHHFLSKYPKNPLIWLRLGESFLAKHLKAIENKNHRNVSLWKCGQFTEMKGDEHFRCRMLIQKIEDNNQQQSPSVPVFSLENLLENEDSLVLQKALFCFDKVLELVPEDFQENHVQFEPHFFYDSDNSSIAGRKKLFLIRCRTLLYQSYGNLYLGNFRKSYSVAEKILQSSSEFSVPIRDLGLAHLYASEALHKMDEIKAGRKLLNFNEFCSKVVKFGSNSRSKLIDILQSVFAFNLLASGAQQGLVKELSKRLQQFVPLNPAGLLPGQILQLSTFEHYWNNMADRARLVANNRLLAISSSKSNWKPTKSTQLQPINQSQYAAIVHQMAAPSSSVSNYQNVMTLQSPTIDLTNFTNHHHNFPQQHHQQQQQVWLKQAASIPMLQQFSQQQQSLLVGGGSSSTESKLRNLQQQQQQQQLREIAVVQQYQQQQQQLAQYEQQLQKHAAYRQLQQQQLQQQQQQSRQFSEDSYQPQFRNTNTNLDLNKDNQFSRQFSGIESPTRQLSKTIDPTLTVSSEQRKTATMSFGQFSKSNRAKLPFMKKTQVQSLTGSVRPVVATEFGPIIANRSRTPFVVGDRLRQNSTGSTTSGSTSATSPRHRF